MVDIRPDTIPVTPDGVLVGTPDCPICFRRLKCNSMPGIGETYWRCSSCGWWGTQELIRMLMRDEGAV